MGKIQTSKKREKSSKNILKGKTALIDGDADAIREILLSHLEQVHKDHFYKEAGISRRALFKLMEPNANPTLDSLAKICKALAEPQLWV